LLLTKELPAGNALTLGWCVTNNRGMAKSAGSGSGGTDIGLLVLRVVLGATLFFKHGLEKITHFSQMSSHFPNPLHVGSHASLIFALLSDAICSLLVVFGLGTRFAAFLIVVNMSVALYFVHHLAMRQEHCEMMLIYIAGFIALIFAGGGRFSLDWKFWGRS
jgi:putative oxidoreductase